MLDKSDFATIRKIVREEVREEVREQLKEQLEEVKIDLKTDIKSDNAKNKDIIIGRLDNIDQELEISKGYKDQLEDHETRIANLEKRSFPGNKTLTRPDII